MAEFKDLIEGYKWRNDLEWRRTAQLAAWVINPFIKKKVKASELLGKGNEKKKTTQEESKQVVEDLKTMMKL